MLNQAPLLWKIATDQEGVLPTLVKLFSVLVLPAAPKGKPEAGSGEYQFNTLLSTIFYDSGLNLSFHC